uniref:Poly [ADP-ribose] polymerase n=1 Tax=Phallusia mammillata TaxID=59560 RepID=A0A6F9DNV3_9ASCI|nr:poly [ADP-ribose] polymerase 15-like [Phallusia mammillata]
MMYETWKWSVNIKRYKRLPPRVGRVIEKALMKTERNHITSLCGHNLRIDTVQREFIYQGIHGHLLGCNHDIQDVPPNWDDMNGKMMRKIILGKTSPEYERVVNQFKASLPQFSNIIKVERIQNPFLHQQYNIRKTDVERHMTLTNPVERELFHGTTNSVTDAICIQGFSLRFSGKHGSAYGQGIYFATTSKFSSRYTD